MKALRRLSTTLFLFCLAGMAMAQDVIVMKDQTTVMCKVLEITNTEIKYKKWNNQDGPTYSISRSEVTSINYQNGEVEKFTETTNNQQGTNLQVHNLNGNMVNSGSDLYLNGHKLSDNEVKNLVDSQNYQLYLKAGRQENTAFVFIIGGGIGLAIAGIIALIEPPDTDYHSTSFKVKIASVTGGLILGMTGWILESNASNKAEKVADTYNNNHGNYSLNISPSLMRYKNPQSQDNYGLGLTLSMNF